MSRPNGSERGRRRRRAVLRWSSLAATLLLVAAWFAATQRPWARSFAGWRIESYGGILVCYIWGDGPEVRSPDAIMMSSRGSLGLEWPSVSGGRGSWTTLTVPYWLIVAPVSGMTALLWLLTRRRPIAGRCHRCGYDLRGIPPGFCPECGTPLPGESTSVEAPCSR